MSLTIKEMEKKREDSHAWTITNTKKKATPSSHKLTKDIKLCTQKFEFWRQECGNSSLIFKLYMSEI